MLLLTFLCLKVLSTRRCPGGGLLCTPKGILQTNNVFPGVVKPDVLLSFFLEYLSITASGTGVANLCLIKG